jgi:hypothetical protein
VSSTDANADRAWCGKGKEDRALEQRGWPGSGFPPLSPLSSARSPTQTATSSEPRAPATSALSFVGSTMTSLPTDGVLLPHAACAGSNAHLVIARGTVVVNAPRYAPVSCPRYRFSLTRLHRATPTISSVRYMRCAARRDRRQSRCDPTPLRGLERARRRRPPALARKARGQTRKHAHHTPCARAPGHRFDGW